MTGLRRLSGVARPGSGFQKEMETCFPWLCHGVHFVGILKFVWIVRAARPAGGRHPRSRHRPSSPYRARSRPSIHRCCSRTSRTRRPSHARGWHSFSQHSWSPSHSGFLQAQIIRREARRGLKRLWYRPQPDDTPHLPGQCQSGPQFCCFWSLRTASV